MQHRRRGLFNYYQLPAKKVGGGVVLYPCALVLLISLTFLGFRFRLSRARRVVENAFGIMAARWRILLKPMEFQPATAVAVVKATVCLHNYLKSTDASSPPTCRYVPATFVDYEGNDGTVVHGEWRAVTRGQTGMVPVRSMSTNMYSRESARIREQLVDFFLSEAGSVPWQEQFALFR